MMETITKFLSSKTFMVVIIACAVAYGLNMIMKTIKSLSDTMKKVIPYAAAAAIVIGYAMISKSKQAK